MKPYMARVLTLMLTVAALVVNVPSSSAMSTNRNVFIAQHSSKCIDANANSNDNGTIIQQYDCNGTSAQVWEVIDVRVKNQPTGYVTIRKAGTSKCLDVPGGSTDKGTGLILWSCHEGSNQQFKLHLHDNHKVSFINRNSNMCLDVAGNSKDNGAWIIQYTCAYGNNQIFFWSW
jgi:hypothetical protein